MGTNVTKEFGVYALDKVLDAATSVRLIVCSSAGWSSEPTEAEIWAGEVRDENGYSRQSVAPVVPASYNETTRRAERPLPTANIAAVGGTIEYSGYCVVLDAGETGSKDATPTNVNNRFTVAGHGLTSGDRILFSAEGGTLPAGIAPLTFYYANVIDADTFAAATDEAATTTQAFTDDGSGVIRLHYCNGTAAFPKRLSSKIIDPSGPAHPFTPIIFFS